MSKPARILLLMTVVLFFAACKDSKKVSLSGEEPVEVTDFIDFFPDVSLPFSIDDTSLLKKSNDSLLISFNVFSQFIPDSVSTQLFGKGVKPKIYPLGKAEGTETYLFAKTVTGDKRTAHVLCFDKKNNFLAAIPLLKIDQSAATQQSSSLDKNFSLTRNVIRKNADGTLSDGKDVYIYNSGSRQFMLIMTDALDDKKTELINPIDTFPRKQKFTADYVTNKMNMISFRDGRGGRLSFFMHFEKGDCTGELKGEARMTGANTAEYREPGDPCSIVFTFTSTSVKVKEIEGCGSRRGLRCSFDATYPRKKEIKAKPAKTSRKAGK